MADDTREPIPPDLEKAFRAAVVRFVDWWGEPENTLLVLFKGEPVSIHSVAESVTNFKDDPMPEDVFKMLYACLDDTMRPLKESLGRDDSYGNGGLVLLQLIKNESERYRITREQREKRP